MAKNNTYDGLAPALYRAPTVVGLTYHMVPEDIGTIFTNRGVAATTTYLPNTADIDAGWFVEIFVVADVVWTITASTVDTMVVFNDAAADSVSFGTSGEHVGGGAKFVWDGTGWLCFLNLGMDSQTPVIAT